MARHTVTVNATSNSVADTEDTFVELSVAQPKIKLVRVRLGDGTAAAGVDNDYRVRLVRKTAGGATGVAGTEVRKQQSDRVSGVTSTIKNGTANFTTATLGDIIDAVVKNGRETFEWIAKDEFDAIEVHPTLSSGGMFAVLIQSAVVSQTFQVTVEWDE